MILIFEKARREKRGIVTTLVTGFIGMAYEGISCCLHNKNQKGLQKALDAMERKERLEGYKAFHLEKAWVMYGIYKAETIEKMVNTVEKMHNKTTWNERLFGG